MFPHREEGQQIVEFVLILVLILIVLVAVYLLLQPQIAKIISTP